jgi:SWI/SNF-related matrix-associated actin-dependent regulator 1 of chromatin subfamily A
MLKKLGFATRKLLVVTTLMALVATVTSCGSDDESATGSRTRNFSPDLDCDNGTDIPAAPLGETAEEAKEAFETILEVADSTEQLAREAAREQAEAKAKAERIRTEAIEAAEAATAAAKEREAEKEAEFRIVQSGRHDESLSEEQRREHRMNYSESYLGYREAREVLKETQTVISDELNDALNVAAAADSEADELAKKSDELLNDVKEARQTADRLAQHAVNTFGEGGKNSAPGAQETACLAAERARDADSEATTALLKLAKKQANLNTVTNQLAALDEDLENAEAAAKKRVELEKQAAEAADKVAELDQIAAETDEYKQKLAEFRVVQSGRNDESLSDEQRREHRINYQAAYKAQAAAQSALNKKMAELGIDFGAQGESLVTKIFAAKADTDKYAASTSKAADDANEFATIAEVKRQVAQQNREALIKKAEMLRDDADSAKNRYFDATMRAQDAIKAANEASVALADAIAKGNADAIAAAELAQAQAQAEADAAAQAQLDAQVEADTQEDKADAAESEALITVEPTTGDDSEVEPVLLAGVPTNVDDDTDAAVPAEVMLIDRPVVTVEEVVDELIFNKNNVEDLLIGAGVAVGAVEVRTNGVDWQTLDQTATNALALGANDEEIEIRVTSNDSEAVIVEKTVEVVRVQPAASITPEQLAMLLPAASTTTSSSSNSTLLIVVVIAVLIALIAVVVVRNKKS